MTPNIYIAFRFHGNFYHSYRGDTPDELGFGKDIRIIRLILNTLDELNNEGIPVCGTWDFENYFSFEKIIPEYSPDIITNLQRRIREGHDDIQIMSYNNGLVSAHTAREFEENIRRSLTNPQGSGVFDLFGDNFQGMVRPQEMMYTPIHLKLYKSLGADSISLFYSALPFNGFSNFVPPLSLEERYNPLTLTYPGIEESMTLVPCYNTGDLADHITLRRWVTHMRSEQLKLDTPTDLLLTIDMDADDDFWVGYDVPVLKNLLPTIGGLRGLVENVLDLEYVVFTTPDRYLKDHAPVNTITIRQDTADGSFDGISSWAEKWSNQRLWTGLERSRILALQTKRLLGGEPSGEIKNLLDQSFDSRLKALSTTHFGMAAPVMNLTREKAAAELIQNAFNSAKSAFDNTEKSSPASFSLFDYVRGESTDLIQFQAKPSRSLVRLALNENAPSSFAISEKNGNLIPSAILTTENNQELIFVDSFEPGSKKDYEILEGLTPPIPDNPVTATDRLLENEFIRLEFDSSGHLTNLNFTGDEISAGRFLDSQITYNNNNYRVEKWEETETISEDIVGVKRAKGVINIQNKHDVQFEREILVAAGLPYVYVNMKVNYPLTENKKYGRGHAARLEQAYDNRWQEVIPCQIAPNLEGRSDSSLKVWKFNYCNHMSSFSLDYSQFSNNIELDSINNHITYSWAAVTDGKMGLLVAQNADVNSSMAFCPLRTRRQEDVSRVLLNPFGSYWGKQYQYSTADTGFGKFLAVTMSAADHINPYAPSYNGRTQEFSLLIAPYRGDSPPTSIQNDAEAFSYPYVFVANEKCFAPPPHQSWDIEGLGKPPEKII